jgi:hypothetical protein
MTITMTSTYVLDGISNDATESKRSLIASKPPLTRPPSPNLQVEEAANVASLLSGSTSWRGRLRNMNLIRDLVSPPEEEVVFLLKIVSKMIVSVRRLAQKIKVIVNRK